MNIGEVALASGISAKMVRYYESIGLIRPPARSAAGYRVYREDELHALRFVKRARSFGFSIAETNDLLGLWRDSSRASAKVKAVALKHVRDLEEKAAELQAMAKTLRHLAKHCHGDDKPDCPILEDLATRPARVAGAASQKK